MTIRLAIALAASVMMALPAGAFELTSRDIAEGGTLKMEQVANVFGCSGGGMSPELLWSNIPEGTKSFVVTAYDPDAPTGSGFWHWVAFDIPPTVSGLPAGAGALGGNSLPAGAIQSTADANVAGYLGACPPPGPAHRYIFTVKALKVEKLGLKANASGALVGFLSNASSLGEASITVTYGR
ncbi:MAG: YbhB/YbcL family Raf kinase inhibitor-like protein [Proteobacteria bacterium]|nr:YbhB/YbcL family Raf kinase inhibitor-like protein [Pseudomonadota bacterium]